VVGEGRLRLADAAVEAGAAAIPADVLISSPLACMTLTLRRISLPEDGVG
jgi:hypothetical protein